MTAKFVSNMVFESRGLKIKAKKFGNPKGIDVLGLHGWLDNANTFELLKPYLDKINLVAIDLPGHGLSDHRSQHTSYYLWEYVSDILEILKQLKWDKTNILAHSMGTGVAAVLAATFPQKVNKLFFLDGLGPAFVTKNDESILDYYKKSVRQIELAKKTQLYGFSNEKEPMFETREAAVLKRMDGSFGNISRKASETLVSRSLLKVENGYRWRHDPRLVLPNHFCMTEKQAQIFIKNIEVPVKILIGNEGLFADRKLQTRINQFKELELLEVEGNHHFHLDFPKETSQTINTFFN